MLFRVEVEAEVRLQVDELMREELKNLKLVRILHCWFKVAHSISSSRKAIDKDKGKVKGQRVSIVGNNCELAVEGVIVRKCSLQILSENSG